MRLPRMRVRLVGAMQPSLTPTFSDPRRSGGTHRRAGRKAGRRAVFGAVEPSFGDRQARALLQWRPAVVLRVRRVEEVPWSAVRGFRGQLVWRGGCCGA